ncbi:hypothetical protein [Nocardioides pacificus]
MHVLRTLLLTITVSLAATVTEGCGDDSGEDGATSAGSTAPEASQAESPSPDAGGSDASSPSGSPSGAAGWAACDEVWQDGSILPRGYRGCMEGDERVRADRQICSLGTTLVTYAERFYAQPGLAIRDVGSLQDSAEYQQDFEICTA